MNSTTKYEPMTITHCGPTTMFPYAAHTNEIDTRDVFADDKGAWSLTYECEKEVGHPTKKMFGQTCKTKVNHFFYPENIEKFFQKTKQPMPHPHEPCANITYYNKGGNCAFRGKHQEVLSDTSCEDSFFNDNSGPMFANKCQTNPLLCVNKYVSAYDKDVDRVSCGTLCCNSSFKGSSMI